jgi:hypothetical protein
VYYKQYCKILAKVIKEAKRLMYNNQVINSGNKINMTWNIIKAETNRIKGHTSSKNQNSPEVFKNISCQQLEKSSKTLKVT